MELFAGTHEISDEFRRRGHKCFTVDWDKQFDVDLHIDIGQLTKEMIINKFGIPDVIFLSPECTTYSVAAISHHRHKNEETGNLDPISDYAKKCDDVNIHVIGLLKEFQKLNPNLLYFIENPRSAFRKMEFVEGLPRYTVWYCKYMTEFPPEQRRAKPTDIFTNHPNPKFRPECKNGATDHAIARRGMATGTQGIKGSRDRSRYPKQLINHIVDISEEYING